MLSTRFPHNRSIQLDVSNEFIYKGGIQMDLSWLLLLACPLMMVFMMFGMKGHGHGSHSDHSPNSQAMQAQLDELKVQIEQMKHELQK